MPVAQGHKSAKREPRYTLRSTGRMAPINRFREEEHIHHAGIRWSIAVIGYGRRGEG